MEDELDLLEPDAQMPRAWEAWEVYQFKSPHSRPCVPKYSLWEAAFSPKNASPSENPL